MALVAYDANSDSDISEDEEEESLIRNNTQAKKLESEPTKKIETMKELKTICQS